MGLGDDLAHSSIRFSLGRFTTDEDVDMAIELVTNGVNHMRELSPIWEMYKEGVDLTKIEWAAH
jgi:cysteine desulfurase